MNQPSNRVEGSYVPQARRIVVARKLLKRAKEELHDAKQTCAKAMHSVNVRDFKFEVDKKFYEARLERKTVRQVSIQKLYTMLANGELTLDTFLECVVPNDEKIKEILPSADYQFLLISKQGPLDLVIEPHS